MPTGLNLLVDIDTTPMLNLVLVDGGSITFPSDEDPNHQRSFDAKNIMVRNGVFEAGTEEEPYSSKLTITLNGSKSDPSIPIYGNKVLAGRFATIDIHGLGHNKSWVNLRNTVAAGTSELKLLQNVDWTAGQKIMITSTSFNRNEAEYATIDSINVVDENSIITLTQPLKYEHYAAKQKYGDNDEVRIRAEVALMERNVIFQGDSESADEEYGALILLYAPGDNSNIGRLSNIQF